MSRPGLQWLVKHGGTHDFLANGWRTDRGGEDEATDGGRTKGGLAAVSYATEARERMNPYHTQTVLYHLAVPPYHLIASLHRLRVVQYSIAREADNN